jgi:UDP-N-acetylmuramoyl-tripeptide--D-alanyl-D-alanine ligase
MQETCHWIQKRVGGEWLGSVADRHLLVDGVSTDTRMPMTNRLFVPLVGTRFDGHDFLEEAVKQGAAAALWQRDHPHPASPPIPLILVDDTLTALQELAAAVRREWEIPVIGVTGSNGKTTTKELIAAVLSSRYRVHKTEGNLNNHIGLPLTLLSAPPDAEAAVVEMGMNHRGEIARLSQLAAPDIGVITNVGEAHLEFLGSREGIAEAKLEIREGLSAKGTLIIHGDEPLLTERIPSDARKVIRIGWGKANDDFPRDLTLSETGISFRSAAYGTRFEVSLPGRHNALNALMAAAVGRALGLSEEAIAEGLRRVRPAGMRLETVVAENGMRILNDAYNASPASVRAAIDWLVDLEPDKKKWVLLGDMAELGAEEERYHREIGRYAVEKGVRRVYTFGDRGRWIAEGAQETGKEVRVEHFSSLEDAAKALREQGNEEVMLLVKASRMIRLERVVQDLTKRESSGS